MYIQIQWRIGAGVTGVLALDPGCKGLWASRS